MIDFNTILSSFNERGTLLKWLKKVEQALEESVLESIGTTQIDETHIKFTLTFVDGSTFESDTITLPRGEKGDNGATGATGNGIVSIVKTQTSDLVDTYTITYTNGDTETFEVTNGKDGENGTDGTDGVSITGVTKTGTSGLVDTYTISYSNGTTSTFQVTNGANGTDGMSITNVTINASNHLIITYSNGITSDAGEVIGMSNPMTSAGAVIYGGANGDPTALPIGTVGQILSVKQNGLAPEWISPFVATLLWENATPSLPVAEQTVSLLDDPTKYKFFVIYYDRSTNLDMMYNISYIPIDKAIDNTINLMGFYGYYGYTRNIRILFSSSEMKILNCYKQINFGTGQQDNSYNIPYKIYGIK